MRFLAALFAVLMGFELGLATEKPNVLFICMDDLNDWVGCMGGHPQARTPISIGLPNRAFYSPMHTVWRRLVIPRGRRFSLGFLLTSRGFIATLR